ncbi:MAG: hypothetical protein K0Q48_841 [Bacillota bacterium]|nr:hypothetical protein [Bacillota bacterium]
MRLYKFNKIILSLRFAVGFFSLTAFLFPKYISLKGFPAPA